MSFYKIKLVSNKKFGFFLSFVFIILSAYFYFSKQIVQSQILIFCAFALIIIALFASSLLTPLNRLWMVIGYILSKILNPIILGFIFFIIVTPIGIIRRNFGNDELMIYKNSKSFWKKRKKNKYNYEFFKKPF